MRPPVLPSGNHGYAAGVHPGRQRCFNEAAGFTQRKHHEGAERLPLGDHGGFNEAAGFTQRKLRTLGYDPDAAISEASMRPPVLPSGNTGYAVRDALDSIYRFNEAAGFTQRKLSLTACASRRPLSFNEAAGFTQRKLPKSRHCGPPRTRRLQ